jgi:hypothetical protein
MPSGCQPSPMRGAPDGVTADTADHERDRPLDRLRRELHAGEAVVAAVEARVLFPPQRAHDLDRLVGDGAALLERAAHRLHLVLDGADADPEDQPAAAQHVEGGRGLREPDRVVVRQHQHRGAQPHARGARGDVAQQRERLVVRPVADALEDVRHVEDVIVRPHRVDAQLLGAGREVDERVRIRDPPVVEQREADPHRLSSSRSWRHPTLRLTGATRGV